MSALLGVLLVLTVTIAGCNGSGVVSGTTPTHLDDLEVMDYTDTQMVIDQLVCPSVTMLFHIGMGVTSEREAVESASSVPSQVGNLIRQAEQVGDELWALATETGQVIGALHSGGGVVLCVQDVADDQE
jgi:hypothetical protein